LTSPIPTPENPALVRIAHYVKSAIAMPPGELELLRRFIRLYAGELAPEGSFAGQDLPRLPTNLGPGCAHPAASTSPAAPSAPAERPVTQEPPAAPKSPPTPQRTAGSGMPQFSPGVQARIKAAQEAARAGKPLAEVRAAMTAPGTGLPARVADSGAAGVGVLAGPSRVADASAAHLNTNAPTVTGPAVLSAGDARQAVAGTEEPAPQTPREGHVPSRAPAAIAAGEGPARPALAPTEVPTREPQMAVTIIEGLPARI
jgi:hypothetical protein